MEIRTGRFWALLPLLIFILTYLVTSLILDDFYKMPVLVAFMVALVVGFLQYPRVLFAKKVEEFSKGAGNPGIMLMCLIFLLAGAFASLSKAIGAVESTIHFGLSYLSPSLFVIGLFLISCFISISLGTSVGTIVAIAPIAVGMHESIGGSLGLSLGAVVGGAMFGDNLSIISDTTIAATRTQGIKMRDKFKVNIKIALPAALITLLLYLFLNPSENVAVQASYSYSLIKISPYIFIFIAALLGMHVIWVLVLGIVFALGIGLIEGGVDIWQAVNAINQGMASMFELSITCILIGGIVGLIRMNGGVAYVLTQISKRIRSKSGAEFGIAVLTGLVNACIANNTITIIITGPIAKEIADAHEVDRKRSASILDTISCFVQGCLPYGAQLLAALAVAAQAVTPLEIMQYLYYPYILGIATLGFMFFRKKQEPV
ncbi:Na+/H+ antiporter NhaC family protein [Rapidithrix thailandica]|uniref:Na+/H+ antiporter NhaC family protein n=1 Tax=Rapidithrix thailandica TaxID=413964 RepID=A0AAW9RZF7_9BACT